MWIPSKLPGAEQTGGSLGGLRWLRGLLAVLCACPWGARGTPRQLCWAGRAGAGQGKAAGGWPRGAGASPTPRLCPPACPCLPRDKAGLCSGTFLGAVVALCRCSGCLPLPPPYLPLGAQAFPEKCRCLHSLPWQRLCRTSPPAGCPCLLPLKRPLVHSSEITRLWHLMIPDRLRTVPLLAIRKAGTVLGY